MMRTSYQLRLLKHCDEWNNNADAHCLETGAKSHRTQQKSGLHPFFWSENVPELSYQLQTSLSPLAPAHGLTLYAQASVGSRGIARERVKNAGVHGWPTRAGERQVWFQ